MHIYSERDFDRDETLQLARTYDAYNPELEGFEELNGDRGRIMPWVNPDTSEET